MSSRNVATSRLEDVRVPTRLKLSALWAATMFCYLYGDYFGLYQPGSLQGMLNGRMGPLGPVTQEVLLGVSVMMAIPSAMVFLSIVLGASVSRWANVLLGLVYTAIVLITTPGAWSFYLFLSLVEVSLTLAVVWYAWTWPRQPPA
ncbi:DUF6326 family protein [soil metagenome]